MHKHIVLAVLVLSGCASPFGKDGKDAMNAALETARQPAGAGCGTAGCRAAGGHGRGARRAASCGQNRPASSPASA